MIQALPKPVQPIIESYVGQLQGRLPGLISGVYLVGSIALGEYNEKFSDVDFITLLHRRMTPVEWRIISGVHQELERNYPNGNLSGSYIQAGDLGRVGRLIEPAPHYQDGAFHSNKLTELSLVTWWELKNHGIPLMGERPESLPFTVDWALLVSQMMENLNSYWAGWTRQPKRILVLYSDWGIQWAVTGVLRQFYTLKENSITTKVKAARYSIGCVPERWHPLIQEAINIREGNNKSVYRSRTNRVVKAVDFLKYIVKTGNAIYDKKRTRPPQNSGT
jgi:hypothetical protein